MKLLIILVLCFTSHRSLGLATFSESEEDKINSLIHKVETMDAVFIRNGKEYPAQEAANHLKKKLKSAQTSFFAPPKNQWTAKLFIQRIASKSSISGNAYLIRFPDGKTEKSEEFLSKELQKLESPPEPAATRAQ